MVIWLLIKPFIKYENIKCLTFFIIIIYWYSPCYICWCSICHIFWRIVCRIWWCYICDVFNFLLNKITKISTIFFKYLRTHISQRSITNTCARIPTVINICLYSTFYPHSDIFYYSIFDSKYMLYYWFCIYIQILYDLSMF